MKVQISSIFLKHKFLGHIKKKDQRKVQDMMGQNKDK